MSLMNNKRGGFTLIELLVVVAIIGVLSSVVLASLSSARAKGRDAKRMADIKQIQNAIELYIADNGNAPDIYAIDRNNWDTLPSFLVPKYIKSLAKDPLNCSLASCDDTNPGTNGNWFAYLYKGPTTLVNEGAASYFGTIYSTSYLIMAESLETNNKSFGFGVGSF